MIHKAIQVASVVSSSFLLIGEQESIVKMCNVILNHSPGDGSLGCFPLLAILSNAAVNMHEQVFAWTYVFSSLGCAAWSGIAGSYGQNLC